MEKYGIENEIKFNPEKTVTMVFNKHVKMTRAYKLKDRWQDDLKMGQEKLTVVENMKYLGVQIDHNNKSKVQIAVRKIAANASIAKLM